MFNMKIQGNHKFELNVYKHQPQKIDIKNVRRDQGVQFPPCVFNEFLNIFNLWTYAWEANLFNENQFQEVPYIGI